MMSCCRARLGRGAGGHLVTPIGPCLVKALSPPDAVCPAVTTTFQDQSHVECWNYEYTMTALPLIELFDHTESQLGVANIRFVFKSIHLNLVGKKTVSKK